MSGCANGTFTTSSSAHAKAARVSKDCLLYKHEYPALAMGVKLCMASASTSLTHVTNHNAVLEHVSSSHSVLMVLSEASELGPTFHAT